MTLKPYPHLTDKAAAAMNLPSTERIAYIQRDNWIPYPAATAILDKLEELLAHPKVERPPNLLVIARSNNGKSSLIKHFLRQHPPEDNLGKDAIHVPVLRVDAPPKPDVVAFFENILNSLFVRYKPSHGEREKRNEVYSVLSHIDLGMIAIDEIHNLIAGPLTKQRAFLNEIKELSNLTKVPIIGLGTSEAYNAIRTDPQLENRFHPMVLPLWEYGKELRQLLASLEKIIPLANPSDLQNPAMAKRVWAISGGTIGEICGLVTEAAIYAIKTGIEQIDDDAMDKCGYQSPSTRKNAIKRA